MADTLVFGTPRPILVDGRNPFADEAITVGPDLVVAAAVLLFYGGMLVGLAPARNGTSWEGHLFGLFAGLGTAWLQYAVL